MLEYQLDILICPRCKQKLLTVLDSQTGLICPHCRLVYPVQDNVPILTDDASIAASAWLMGVRGSVNDTSQHQENML